MKLSHVFLYVLLVLSFSIILLCYHEFYNSFNEINELDNITRRRSSSSSSSSTPRHLHQAGLLHRKALASNKFDFAPFLKNHRHRKRKHPVPAAGGNEIDPRYGVEKRLVPTGPNPLHH
ncbi:OLC1v1032401C1 [Oldenlandia corymbosa var. corymbosa]|uniref:OLC1v1032401C1 n=1 Tax=Oldenlandia corymbosa var. corymbosa TaxID=529605 RepID=A0AAV1CP48_OLDCO|nr:OLC1v1032401C1 [Oldenlandia corymbosa var. corymbosa]